MDSTWAHSYSVANQAALVLYIECAILHQILEFMDSTWANSYSMANRAALVLYIVCVILHQILEFAGLGQNQNS